MTTKTEVKKATDNMKPEAVKIWSADPGQEAVRPDLPDALDITKFQGEAFRCRYIRREDYDYDYKGQERKGVSFVADLLVTSAAECKKLEGKVVGIYGRGLLNYQMKNLAMVEGDLFVVACTGQDKVGDTNPYQFTLKKLSAKK